MNFFADCLNTLQSWCYTCLPFSPLFLRVRSIWSLSWIRTWRSVGWSLMKECLSSCSVDGRLGYVFTRQLSIKSINFLDLAGWGRLEDKKTWAGGKLILGQVLHRIQIQQQWDIEEDLFTYSGVGIIFISIWEIKDLFRNVPLLVKCELSC